MTELQNEGGEPPAKRRTRVRIDFEAIIGELLRLRSCKPGTSMNPEEISEDILAAIACVTRVKFQQQPMLLDLDAPIKICGDVHGQFCDLLRLLELGRLPPHSSYLFLGDYVDRGQQSLECLALLFTYKLKYPENIFLLRGNHECDNINRQYGFFDECKRRYSIRLWKRFSDAFSVLPVAARIDDRILCMHGGLSQDLHDVEDILAIERPCQVPEKGLLCDLLWSDPSSKPGWNANERGVSFVFGPDVVEEFCQFHEIDLICRAHQVVQDGYLFFAGRRLVTVFGAPNYCGEFNNSAALLVVDKDLECSFQLLQPMETALGQKAVKAGMNNHGDTVYSNPHEAEGASSEEIDGNTGMDAPLDFS
eukprot:GEMP01048518.1.p1 GENE.GEMP01048518.1~~GEMP01048518.1.p1  ORF type:complete len:364 (+),score=64.14 GEMP01048518.1:96-1187(+)